MVSAQGRISDYGKPLAPSYLHALSPFATDSDLAGTTAALQQNVKITGHD
jgi:hypothetical protein